MSIPTIYKKSKYLVIYTWHFIVTIPTNIPRDGIIVLLLIMTAFVSFGLGFLAGTGNPSSVKSIKIESRSLPLKGGVNIGKNREVIVKQKASVIKTTNIHTIRNERVVVSKNGSKYYLSSCSGAKRIHKENEIWFNSIALAQAKGYTPSIHCFGK